MHAQGVFGEVTSRLKQRLIHLPIMSFGFTQALLRSHGHGCNVFHDENIGSADIVIIASSMHCHVEENELAERLKASLPNAKIGFYGPFAFERPEYFEKNADFIIGGELETAILAFFDGEYNFDAVMNYGVSRTSLRSLCRIGPACRFRNTLLSHVAQAPLFADSGFEAALSIVTFAPIWWCRKQSYTDVATPFPLLMKWNAMSSCMA